MDWQTTLFSKHSVQNTKSTSINKQNKEFTFIVTSWLEMYCTCSQILFETPVTDWRQVMHYRWNILTLFCHRVNAPTAFWRWSPLLYLPGFHAVHDAIASLRHIGNTKAKLDKGELQRDIRQIQRNMVALKEPWLDHSFRRQICWNIQPVDTKNTKNDSAECGQMDNTIK